MIKLRATYEVTYNAIPENYGTEDPAEMAKIDQKNFQSDPFSLFETTEDDGVKITVTWFRINEK